MRKITGFVLMMMLAGSLAYGFGWSGGGGGLSPTGSGAQLTGVLKPGDALGFHNVSTALVSYNPIRIALVSDLHYGFTDAGEPLAGAASLTAIYNDFVNIPVDTMFTNGDNIEGNVFGGTGYDEQLYEHFLTAINDNINSKGIQTILNPGNHDWMQFSNSVENTIDGVASYTNYWGSNHKYTKTTLASAVTASATSCALASTTGFTVGDHIFFWDRVNRVGEGKVITSISGTTVNMAVAFANSFAVDNTLVFQGRDANTIYSKLSTMLGPGQNGARSLSKVAIKGNSVFIMLAPDYYANPDPVNYYSSYITNDGLVWLEDKLKQFAGYNTFVFSHVPLIGSGLQSTNTEPTNKYEGATTAIQALLQRYKVTAWFSGHMHYDPDNNNGQNVWVTAPGGFGGTMFVGIPSGSHKSNANVTYAQSKAWWVYGELKDGDTSWTLRARNSTDGAWKVATYATIPLNYPVRKVGPTLGDGPTNATRVNGYTFPNTESAVSISVTPPAITSALSAGGSLVNGTTYYYVVTALGESGESLASAETSKTAGSGTNTITVAFPTPSLGAYSYNIYRSTTSGVYGATSFLYNKKDAPASYSDNGAISLTTGTPPAITSAVSTFLGLGTSAPKARIDIINDRIGTNSLNGELWLRDMITSSSSSGTIRLAHNNALGLLPSNDDRLGYLVFGTVDPGFAGTNFRTMASVRAFAGENSITGTNAGSYLTFGTTANGTITHAEKARIQNDGALCVGNTTCAGSGVVSATKGIFGNMSTAGYMKSQTADVNGALTAGTVTSAGPVLHSDGTVSAPGISFSSDTDNGFYKIADKKLGLTLGNSNVITFDNSVTPALTTIVGQVANGAILFANLGTPVNGTTAYCSDCTTSTPATCTASLLTSCTCAGSGTGAFAKRLNGAWYCN